MPGFFGKLPGSGDFLSRGLTAAQRSWLDGWLTRWLARFADDPECWPPGGLRAVLDAPGGPLVAVIGPSVDLAGRSFPALACEVAPPKVSRASADAWADLAAVALARAVEGLYDADTLISALATIPAPGATSAGPALAAPLVWSDATEGPPETAISAILGSDPNSD